MDIVAQIEKYAYSFPFTPIPLDQIAGLEKILGFSLLPLLAKSFNLLGEGNYWLTLPFFTFDLDYSITKEVLLSKGASIANSVMQDDFGLRYEVYEIGRKELVIGNTDEMTFFVEDASSTDPVVRCLVEGNGVVVESKRLSSIVSGFKYFATPTLIPQFLIDYEWCGKTMGFGDLISTSVADRAEFASRWVSEGRPGLPENLRSHPDSDSSDRDGPLSVFDPDFHL